MKAQSLSLPGGEARLVPRTQLFLSATIRFDKIVAAVQLRDLSASGARVDGARLPPIGSTAHIARGALSASGTIVWRDRNRCGLRFDEPLPIDDWMPPRLSADQQIVDNMVEEGKSGEAKILPLRPDPPPSDALRDALPQRMAEELGYVCRLLESLGDDLCSEPLIVVRHGQKLQDLDLSAQILGHVAALLVADHPERAVDAIGMGSLRKRLKRSAL